MALLNNKNNESWWETDDELCIRFAGGFQLLIVLGGFAGGAIAAFLIRQRIHCGPADQCFAHGFSPVELAGALGMAGIVYTFFSRWLSRHLVTRIDVATGTVHGWLRTCPREAFRAIVIADSIGGKLITLAGKRLFGPNMILGYRFSERDTVALSTKLAETLKLPALDELDLQPALWQQRFHTVYLITLGSAFVTVTVVCEAIFAKNLHQSLAFAPLAVLFVVTGLVMIRYALTPVELRGKHMFGYRIRLAFGSLFLIAIPTILFKELSQLIHQIIRWKDWSAYLVKARQDPSYMLGVNMAFALTFLRSGWKLRKESLKEKS